MSVKRPKVEAPTTRYTYYCHACAAKYGSEKIIPMCKECHKQRLTINDHRTLKSYKLPLDLNRLKEDHGNDVV